MLMPTTTPRCIIVGVSGGIAAYKSPQLVRQLVARGAQVRVVMTEAATAFITPLTLQAVSGHPVHQYLLDSEAEAGIEDYIESSMGFDLESGMGHIALARWAQQIIIAPASAHTIAKLAHGLADDLLTTLALASTAELIVAPAMNQQMWQHAATVANIRCLQQRGVRIIGPEAGDQACGETGPGRMTEPEPLAAAVFDDMPTVLRAKTVLITAGPTWEALDPVRGFTNHSSGKMGFAMATAARDCGARVVLVSGAVTLPTPSGVTRIVAGSAQQMHDCVFSHIAQADIFIGVAAVADYRPEQPAAQKIKKTDDALHLRLVKNPDILARVAALDAKPFTVGFAAETENIVANATAKLHAKNLDLIVANDVAQGAAFGRDSNAVILIHRHGQVALRRTAKSQLARQIMHNLADLYAEHTHQQPHATTMRAP